MIIEMDVREVLEAKSTGCSDDGLKHSIEVRGEALVQGRDDGSLTRVVAVGLDRIRWIESI